MTEPPAIDYKDLMTGALRSVVSRVLQRVAEEGLPGDHHFYLTFATDVEGVEISPELRDRFPDEMTIVLQNQFWDLYADDQRLAVKLRFDGVVQQLVIPYASLTAFVDPPAEFALTFTSTGHDEDDSRAADQDSAHAADPPEVERAPDSNTSADAIGANVVRIDSFRKR